MNRRGRSDIRTGTGSLRAEIKSLRTTIIVIGGGYWASIVGGFIALLVTALTLSPDRRRCPSLSFL